MRGQRLLGLALALGLGTSGAAADVVTDWNAVLIDAVRTDRTNPPRMTRHSALVHVAVYDAVVGLVGGYEPYFVASSAPTGASPEAAAAAAAHRVLTIVYPAQTATFDAALAASLGAIPDGPAEEDGVDWGVFVADEILNLRAADGSATTVTYETPAGANWWIPTPPAFAPALLPNWPLVTPWCMTHGAQFRQPAPPPLTSGQYTAAFREVQILGDVDSATRTAEQSEIALFWNDGAGTNTPPGHWQEIAQTIAQAQGNSLVDNARLFALLTIAQADAAIVSWDNKYHWDHWRPYTGIVEAASDGNPGTSPDASFSSFIATPPFPAYTSGHSTFSGSSARILAHFFGTDAISFSAASDGLPGVTRSFESLSQAAEEAGQSRIYGGIHWQYDNQGGLASGRALGDLVFFNFLQPVTAPGTCQETASTLCLGGGRFQVQASWKTPNGNAGPAQAASLTDDSGRFWFFNPDNTELTVKVLNACSGFDRYWVFASGLTNVEVQITVTDTEAGKTRRYFIPQGRDFAPVLDASAFATCP
jgi:hypothetical protein